MELAKANKKMTVKIENKWKYIKDKLEVTEDKDK